MKLEDAKPEIGTEKAFREHYFLSAYSAHTTYGEHSQVLSFARSFGLRMTLDL